MESLPFRVDERLVKMLGTESGNLEVSPRDAGLPALRGTLPRGVSGPLSLVVRVHSRAGIPLASGPASLNTGDLAFESTLAIVAMEGYAHLKLRQRKLVEDRVWSRRAYATVSMA